MTRPRIHDLNRRRIMATFSLLDYERIVADSERQKISMDANVAARTLKSFETDNRKDQSQTQNIIHS